MGAGCTWSTWSRLSSCGTYSTTVFVDSFYWLSFTPIYALYIAICKEIFPQILAKSSPTPNRKKSATWLTSCSRFPTCKLPWPALNSNRLLVNMLPVYSPRASSRNWGRMKTNPGRSSTRFQNSSKKYFTSIWARKRIIRKRQMTTLTVKIYCISAKVASIFRISQQYT